MGGVSLNFARVPATPRADVVLPEAVLGRVERHALGVAEHRQALLDHGQHLKRGLLLFGPPGTGKTHTTHYLVAEMAGYTRLLLRSRSRTRPRGGACCPCTAATSRFSSARTTSRRWSSARTGSPRRS
ncbi:MAG: ATP-binding protein [Actinomycetota bacterium]|nr:ATP-binding protein [Actinomycetota bacterium]